MVCIMLPLCSPLKLAPNVVREEVHTYVAAQGRFLAPILIQADFSAIWSRSPPNLRDWADHSASHNAAEGLDYDTYQ